jgi:hypothetical protein
LGVFIWGSIGWCFLKMHLMNHVLDLWCCFWKCRLLWVFIFLLLVFSELPSWWCFLLTLMMWLMADICNIMDFTWIIPKQIWNYYDYTTCNFEFWTYSILVKSLWIHRNKSIALNNFDHVDKYAYCPLEVPPFVAKS